MERGGALTVKGEPSILIGEEIKAGQTAPDFKVLSNNMEDVYFGKLKDKIKLIASVPSLDTPICDLEIKRFNDEASKLSKDLIIIFVSMDLPFAQKRFCHDNNIKKVKTFSDHRDADFGNKYGVLIKDSRLLSRAIFIVDKENIVRYVEYVRELTSQPDYNAALSALKGVIK